MIDRYHQHGLRSNPFAVVASGDTDDFFVDRGLGDPPPPGSCTLVQLIGDKGFGKSTQIKEWARRSPGPYHYVVPGPYRDRWSRPPVEPLVYADEIDRMPRLLRRRWFRRLAQARATVVAGTHVDLSMIARRCELGVVTHALGPAEPSMVRAVLEGRITNAAMPGSAFALTDAELSDIHWRANGSLRAAEVAAHELVAQRVVASPSPRLNGVALYRPG